MVDLFKFLEEIRTIRALNPIYRLGGSGVDGTCDCIGLIIGAIRRAGGTWTGTHGSNYAARSEMAGRLRHVASLGELEVGEAVYKAWKPGDAKYALPDKYRSGGDLLDYYHVGVVTGTSPLEITHCTGPGVIVDTKLGKWGWAGKLKKINYGEGIPLPDVQVGKAKVTAPDGNPVKLRPSPDTSKPYLAKVPVGDIVDVLEIGSEWCTVLALRKRGYMMRQFLELEGAGNGVGAEPEAEVLPAEQAALLARFEALEARMAAIEARL